MTLITANELRGITNQDQAGSVLRKLLEETPRGKAQLDVDATKGIEKGCPALARNIHNAIDDWNHNRHSFISDQPAVSQF